MLEVEDEEFQNGMAGCGSFEMGRTSFWDFFFEDIQCQ